MIRLNFVVTVDDEFEYEESHTMHSIILNASDRNIKNGLLNFLSPKDINLGSGRIGRSKYSFSELPNVLIFQIQRAIFENGSIVKDTSKFKISNVLKLKYNHIDSADYRLHSILMHKGPINSGHFYIYIFDLQHQHFIKYSDEDVEYVNIDDVMLDSIGQLNEDSYSVGVYYIRNDVKNISPFEVIFESNITIDSYESSNHGIIRNALHGPFDYVDIRDEEKYRTYIESTPSISSFVTNDFSLDPLQTSEFEESVDFIDSETC